jgi:hypothetical protein
LRALGEELWDAFSPVDGRIARTLWALVRRPGELTVAYMRGERLPYVPPLRLFLLVNVLFFLHASVMHTHALDTPLRVHMHETEHARIATRLVTQKLGRLAAQWTAQHHRAPTKPELDALVESYGRRFNENSTTQAKSLVIAMVPMFALLVTALEWRRRRYALQDLVFSLHAMTMILLVFVVGVWLVAVPIALMIALARLHPTDHQQDIIYSAAMMCLFALWARAALRRAYADGPAASIAKAVAVSAGFAVVLFAYRALLFFTVFYTTP